MGKDCCANLKVWVTVKGHIIKITVSSELLIPFANAYLLMAELDRPEVTLCS